MKKIMFKDKYSLTQAVLEGRKTQTRRIIPKDFFSLTWDESGNTLVYENSMGDFIDIRNSKYALYKVGEVVAVAQSYKDIFSAFSQNPNPQLNIGVKNPTDTAGWNNKMFVKGELMPHQIRITDARVEKLQDISDEDCLKEGIIKGRCGSEDTHFMDAYYCPTDIQPYCEPREAFAHLINKVSRKEVWQENPYVFVYDFELVK